MRRSETEMVAWLASDEATFVTGRVLTVDGGLTAASPLRPGLFGVLRPLR